MDVIKIQSNFKEILYPKFSNDVHKFISVHAILINFRLRNYKKAPVLMRMKLRSKCLDALSVLYIHGDLSSKNVDTKDEFLSISKDGKEKFRIRTETLMYVSVFSV